jgi:hypothetical protein
MHGNSARVLCHKHCPYDSCAYNSCACVDATRSGMKISIISCGYAHTVIANADGKVFSWGLNFQVHACACAFMLVHVCACISVV